MLSGLGIKTEHALIESRISKDIDIVRFWIRSSKNMDVEDVTKYMPAIHVTRREYNCKGRDQLHVLVSTIVIKSTTINKNINNNTSDIGGK
jgi:hypothetical protein